MASTPKFASVEKLVRLDIDDAFSAERMLHLLVRRSLLLGHLGNSDEARGIRAIERALSFRFTMAVQRLLQGDRSKATLKALLAAAIPSIDKDQCCALAQELEALRNLEAAKALQSCRNEFMAHTVIDSRVRSTGIGTQPVLDLLFEIAKFVEKLHLAVTGERIDAHHQYDRYCEIARKTWDLLLSGIEDLPPLDDAEPSGSRPATAARSAPPPSAPPA